MDFKCDELILRKTDADSRALTLIHLGGYPPRRYRLPSGSLVQGDDA